MRRKHLFTTVVGMMFSIFVLFFVVAPTVSHAAEISCTDCTPQCLPYARSITGIMVYGAAVDTLSTYDKKKYKISATPKDRSIIILSPYQPGVYWTGHAIAVVTSEKKNGEYKLKISQSNYDCKCSVEAKVSATFKNGKITFKSGAWKGKTKKVQGIIVKK